MIANAALLAALSVFLFGGWLAGELRFLAPYKTVLFHEHAALIGVAALILFLNLTATYYSVARWLFMSTFLLRASLRSSRTRRPSRYLTMASTRFRPSTAT